MNENLLQLDNFSLLEFFIVSIQLVQSKFIRYIITAYLNHSISNINHLISRQSSS